MTFEYCLMQGDDHFDELKLKNFILDVNLDFPIPITDKISVDEFLTKIKKVGNVYCAYYQKEIVGCAFFYANDKAKNIAFLTLIAVSKKYRNCGIGGTLLDYMINYCEKLNFDTLQLYTHELNVGARRFYSKRGFYEIVCDRENNAKLELKLGEKK
ncbi:MAG: GNAT family N-acetyltransferase [Erysipelotrichaceae bacterium]|nr:GNAT family N-acetyltransferase [Erysipelotrichaceae bacterium]